jgi:hypothetical protein
MEVTNLLKKLDRVQAPKDFEQKVLAQLSLRKRERIRVNRFRFSLASAVSAVAVLIIIFNIIILPQKGAQQIAGLEGEIPVEFARSKTELGRADIIPILESMDYKGEISAQTPEPKTIYILEQVSDSTNTKIKY